MEIDSILEGLTEEQSQAVTFGQGPLLIVAGAGTGKTSVLTKRIAYLIASGQARPSQILALTFTDKAAREMQERVDVLLPLGYSDVTVCTFHSFGDRVLRQYAMEFGLDSEFRILSTAEQVIFLRKRLFQLPLKRYRPLGNPTTYLSALIKHFSKLKDEAVEPARYMDWAEGMFANASKSGNLTWADRANAQLELARCYQFYSENLLREGCLDFGDLVYLALKLFRERPAVLEKLAERYTYLLVDEFQDTNSAQFELVRLLAGERANLTVVGDDDQSIYAFRGAAIANILGFQEHYPSAANVVLTANFRSRQEILDCSYRLIRENDPERLEIKAGIDKRLRAANRFASEREPIEYHQFEAATGEADAVAERIAEWIEEGRYSANDVAILVRVNRDADTYLRALNARGIRYRFSGSEGLYHRHEIRILTSFLRLLGDPHDSLSLFFLASSPIYQFPMADLMKVSGFANQRHLPLLEAFSHAELPPLSEAATSVLERLLSDYQRYVALIPDTSPGRLLYQFLDESGWLKQLASGQAADGEAQIHNIARFFDGLRRFEEESPGALLPQFLEHHDLLIEAGDSPGVVEADPDEDAVHVLTVHRSKGLEFPAVFLVGLAETRFPGRPRSELLEFPGILIGRQAVDPDEELAFHHQEERRLFYVALTRAKERLWLSNALDFGGRGQKPVSRFVREALALSRAQTGVIRPSSLERVHRMAPTQVGEELPPVPADRTMMLSYARVRDYRECPLKYKYRHVLRIPVEPEHGAIYGTAMHETISDFLKALQLGERLSVEQLQDRFRQRWKQVGFVSREHEQHRFEAGLEALARFHARQCESGLIPIGVEQEFTIRLDNIRLQGRWDRVDCVGDRVVLTDYKTSEVTSQSKADEQCRSNLQLAIYVLAYESLQKVRPAEVRLHFLDSDRIGTSRVGQEHLSTAHQQVLEAAQGIRQRDYTPKLDPGVCGRCAYKEICPHTAR